MLNRLLRFIKAQDPDEIDRQCRLLWSSHGTRRLLTFVVYGLTSIFLPLWLTVSLALIDTTSETLGLRLMRGLEPAKTPQIYLATVATVIMAELCYMFQAALVWQHDSEYAKSLAVGLTTMTLLQLTSFRTIHLPYAIVGWLTVLLMSGFATAALWLDSGDSHVLVISLIGLAGAAYFTYITMRSNHELHDAMARGRSAAMAADEAKSRFLAQMSHELRTPLNAILGLGYAEMSEAHSPDSRERLELITGSARGLGVILDDILDMSAIREQRLPIRPAVADPAAEIAAACALFRPQYVASGLWLRLVLREDAPPPQSAMLDAQRLRQCLSNLLVNALKHTESGGVEVAVRVLPDQILCVDVTDTGEGVRPEEAEWIFEPFSRGNGGVGPGSGLGLSISRSLARAMGGNLELVPWTEGERGAKFRLTLRLGPLPGESARAAAPLKPASRPMRRSLRRPNARVLVVDDIATNRLVAAAHLRLHGIIPEEASSGEEALRRIRAAPPDLVLLDINMPGLDGLATLRHIRAEPGRVGAVPIIAMTADATEDHRRNYLAAGMDGYLAKPLTPDTIATLLDLFLGPAVPPPVAVHKG